MRGDGFEFVSRKPDRRDGFLAQQRLGQFLQDGLFSFARIAVQTRLDRIEVFHQQVAERGAGSENGVGSEQLLLFHHVRLGIGLFLRLGQTLPKNIALDNFDLRESGLALRVSVRGAAQEASALANGYVEQLKADKELERFDEINPTNSARNLNTGRLSVDIFLKLKVAPAKK